jgi:hypothetical protein
LLGPFGYFVSLWVKAHGFDEGGAVLVVQNGKEALKGVHAASFATICDCFSRAFSELPLAIPSFSE